MDIIIRLLWLIPFRYISQIPLLCMDIYSIGPTMSLPITPTIATSMALIIIAMVAITLTFGTIILGIWVAPVLLSEMARLATVLALVSKLPSTMIRPTLFMAM